MKNRYLTRFMPITWENKENEITITFQAVIGNDQDLVHTHDRIGTGYALCIYKLVPKRISAGKSKTPPAPTDFKEGEKLETIVHTMDLKYDWKKDEDHITSLVILHNPAADEDSMSTSEAPMMR